MVKVVAVICFLALVGFTHCAAEKFNVEGKVYCDTCRVQFETKISENIKGAVVRLDCKNMENETVTYTTEGTTKEDGSYSLVVEGEHEKDACDVTVVKSPREDCKETVPGLEKARVECTDNAGIESSVRQANPLFFMKDKADDRCPKVLEEIAYVPGQESM